MSREGKFLSNFAKKIAPNVSPLEGNSLDDDETIAYGLVAGTRVGNVVESVNWTDSIIQRCRFESTVIANSSFERVAILDSDLSGVTFRDCLLRDCLIMGIKSQSSLAFDNCILDGALMVRSRVETVQIQHCHIASLDFRGVESGKISFHHCKPHKRKGMVSLRESEVSTLLGLDALGRNNITVEVDVPLWRDLGDALLKAQGIQPLADGAKTNYDLLDEIDECVTGGRS